jgi:sarcosine/dimethylglycine N-methyltransferase
MNQDVDWENRCLVTPTNYSTEWLHVPEVQKLLRAYDVNVPDVLETPDFSKNHINTSGLSIFVWFNQENTSRAKTYYDSNDAQRFYSNIWGEETVHIGRHDLLTTDEKTSLSKQEKISRAQVLHEREFVSLIQSKFDTKIRIVDMGCGFGGLLRRIWEAKLVSKATGCDISAKMCDQARRLNQQLGCSKDITILEESYLDITMAEASADLVISMDALLHTGPEGQRQAVQEATRILRPGGWMIFSDIMQQEEVDQVEMQPIYDRIHLDKLGTVSNYKSAFEQAGFTNFSFEEHSSNVSTHYGTIREVLHEKANGIGLSEEYTEKMSAGLQVWKELAPKNIVWGFVCAQKKEE